MHLKWMKNKAAEVPGFVTLQSFGVQAVFSWNFNMQIFCLR